MPFDSLRPFVIAIDGPAGVGKSTVAQRVAAALSWRYVDTGAMYRAVAWKALKEGVSLYDRKALEALARTVRIAVTSNRRGQFRLRLNGREITRRLRGPAMDRAVSSVAQVPGVRRAMVKHQRQVGLAQPSVVEGRDIGTVVFPDARWKFFLTATIRERAHRRYRELVTRGVPVRLRRIQGEIARRDAKDRGRRLGPLRKASDAIAIETTDRTALEVVDLILQGIQQH